MAPLAFRASDPSPVPMVPNAEDPRTPSGPSAATPAPEFHFETLLIYKLSPRKFTTYNDLFSNIQVNV
jgi:hypothetical protein